MAVRNTAPTISLVTYEELGLVALVPQGYGYNRCTTTSGGDPQVPLNRQPCDPGALADDFEDGNITARVLVCPPDSCGQSGTCEGHRFIEKLDLETACGIDTNAPVGSVFRLRYAVYDSGMLSAATERTILIINKCADGQYLCASGKVCSDVPCDGEFIAAHASTVCVFCSIGLWWLLSVNALLHKAHICSLS